MATQTARSAPSLGEFLLRFRGRVYSISHSQDLITDANWHGARLRDLVRSQAGKYHERPQETLNLVGADPMLSPNEALHVGLAIHELFVDAIALGEVSPSFPVVTVSCEEKPYAGEPGLEIMWLQANPPEVTSGELVAAKVDGFHSTVLNRIAPTAVGGKASYENTRAGPRYRLHFPQSE